MSGSDRPVIGWTEYVDLPEWGIRGLRAKVDTGARTSALHVENVEELPGGRVRFEVVLHRRSRDRRVRVEARVQRRGRVRSSSGHFTTRVFVATRLRLGPHEHPIELNLVEREHMIHRMLLGRSALAGRYLVDVGHKALVGRPRRRRLRPARRGSRGVRSSSST
jgi:hypothetical protein